MEWMATRRHSGRRLGVRHQRLHDSMLAQMLAQHGAAREFVTRSFYVGRHITLPPTSNGTECCEDESTAAQWGDSMSACCTVGPVVR